MSKRNNKKHKIAEMEGGSREGTPKKLKVFSEFNETFRDTNDVDDNFVVSKNFKDKGKLLNSKLKQNFASHLNKKYLCRLPSAYSFEQHTKNLERGITCKILQNTF